MVPDALVPAVRPVPRASQASQAARATRRRAQPAAWACFLGAAAVGVGACYLIPPGVLRDALNSAYGLAAVVAVEAGLRVNRPARTAPWHLLALGTLLWFAGDVLGTWDSAIEGVSTFPTPVTCWATSASGPGWCC